MYGGLAQVFLRVYVFYVLKSSLLSWAPLRRGRRERRSKSIETYPCFLLFIRFPLMAATCRLPPDNLPCLVNSIEFPFPGELVNSPLPQPSLKAEGWYKFSLIISFFHVREFFQQDGEIKKKTNSKE